MSNVSGKRVTRLPCQVSRSHSLYTGTMISLTVFKTSLLSLQMQTLTVQGTVILIFYMYPVPVLHIFNVTCLTEALCSGTVYLPHYLATSCPLCCLISSFYAFLPSSYMIYSYWIKLTVMIERGGTPVQAHWASFHPCTIDFFDVC